MIDYRKTLNLPYTKFPMRANLPVNEIDCLNRWNNDRLYQKIRCKKNKKKIFLLHDGPPYANGCIHLGHAVNKILKDFILKSKSFSGYDAPYIPGWDCHGLPVELQVEQLIKKSGINVDLCKFHSLCRQYVLKQVGIQKKDFMRLGVLGDWNHSYLTMDFKTEANTIRTLNKVISNGYIYKGSKPVYWCFQCRSALAHAEVEYRDHFSNAVDIGFSVVDSMLINKIFNINLNVGKNIEFIIWTTTVWTIPSNQAISVHPDYKYQLIKIIDHDRYIIIVANLINVFMKRINCKNWEILGETLGSMLEYLKVKHPFMLSEIPIILSKHITLESGTGIVHIAPNHGIDDYNIAQKYNFKEIVNLIDEQGYYLFNSHKNLDGIHIFKSNDIIINLLHQSNNLLHIDYSYKHSYPYCWRHMIPVIFKVTSQWFLNMDHNNLRSKLLKVIDKVVWMPNKGRFYMKSMIMDRPDWCISRQRSWGIPIPVFIHKNTGLLHPNTSVLMERVAELVEHNGIQIWWNLKIEDFIGLEDAMLYEKVYDTIDVWFDAGSTHDAVVPEKLNCLKEGYIIDLYLEGSDQYRGWFMSSMVISMAISSQSSYKTVLSHGFTVDADGNKMSKSRKNIVSPQNIINKFGADILRLWVSSVDYSKDMIISENILKHVIDIYRRIRNTARFLLANLGDFNPECDFVQPDNMIALDRWAINQALSVQLKIIADYDRYQFHNVIQHIMHFCTIDMGSLYLDIIKDRQYTLHKSSTARRSCQTTLYHIIEAMVRWIAPILSFTADEIWKYIPGNRSQYVFTEEWYDGLFKIDENQLVNSNYWEFFFEVKNQVNRVIEKARIEGIIKGSLESDVILYANSRLAKKLRLLGNELSFGLITSSAVVVECNFSDDKEELKQKENTIKLKVILEKSKGIKCVRCWNYTWNINQNPSYHNVCSRCVNNIVGPGEDRKFF